MQKLILTKVEPNKIGDGYEFAVLATLRERGKPIKGILVQFYIGIDQDGDPIETDENGLAKKKFFKGPGVYTVIAHVTDAEGARAVFEIKADPKKESRRPKKLKITKTQKGSRHFVTLTVLDAIEDGVGIPGCIVRAMDNENNPPSVDLPKTDTFGVTSFEYELFARRDAKVNFIILGTDVVGEILLRRET